jgi:ribosomal protein S18 acetylase RimI-like enzyme
MGYEKILVEARTENIRAINLYEKMRFTKIGLKKYPENQNLSEVIVLEKTI